MWRWMVVIAVVGMGCAETDYHATAQVPEKAAEKIVRLDLGELVSIKAARAETPSVIVGIPFDRQGTRTVQVARTRSEQRTRVVSVDGKAIEQNYVVAVPYTEQVEQVFTVREFKEQTISVLNIAGWDLQGKRISDQELIDRLANHPVAFMLESPWPDGAALDPQQRAVLRDDVLALHLPQSKKRAPDQIKR
jgi:hypothetical protein